MAKPRLIVKGKEKLERHLKFLGEYVKQHSDPVFRKHAEWQRKKLSQKAYPPRLPNQQYVRTFQLQRRFGVRKLGNAEYAITNDRQGAKFVIKKGMQNRKLHAWRWWTVDDEVESNLPVLGKSLIVDINEGLD